MWHILLNRQGTAACCLRSAGGSAGIQMQARLLAAEFGEHERTSIRRYLGGHCIPVPHLPSVHFLLAQRRRRTSTLGGDCAIHRFVGLVVALVDWLEFHGCRTPCQWHTPLSSGRQRAACRSQPTPRRCCIACQDTCRLLPAGN